MQKPMAKRPRGRKPRPRQVPQDTVSYRQYIDSLTQRINSLVRHLKDKKNFGDGFRRRRMETLIEQRAEALNHPPPTVDPMVMAQLKEAIRVGN